MRIFRSCLKSLHQVRQRRNDLILAPGLRDVELASRVVLRGGDPRALRSMMRFSV